MGGRGEAQIALLNRLNLLSALVTAIAVFGLEAVLENLPTWDSPHYFIHATLPKLGMSVG